MSIPERKGTKSQRVVLIPLLVLGIIVASFTIAFGFVFLYDPTTADFPDRWNLVLGAAVISFAFLFPFYILYKKWKLKWNWGF